MKIRDLKNIDVKDLKNIKISKEDFGRFFGFFMKYRGVIFIIFWGIVVIYSFNILYKKAYIDVQFIDYDYEYYAGIGKEMADLEKISDDVKYRKIMREADGLKNQRNPFEISTEESVPIEENGEEDAEIEEKSVPGQW